MMDIGPVCELVALASVHLRVAPIKGCLDFSMAVSSWNPSNRTGEYGLLTWGSRRCGLDGAAAEDPSVTEHCGCAML